MEFTVTQEEKAALQKLSQGGRDKYDEPSVPTLAILQAQSLDGLSEGEQVFVESVDAWFTLALLSAQAVDGITVVATSGTGRWLRESAPSVKWTNQLAWYVDPVAGNDENVGSAVGTALKTVAEWCRRVIRMRSIDAATSLPNGKQAYDITCLNDVPATDCFRPTGTIEPQVAGATAAPVVLRGQRTVLATGTAGPGSSLTVPATNTQAIFDTGTGIALPSTWIGAMVRITSGASIGALAWITKDLGAGLARVSEWVTVVDGSPVPAMTALTSVAAISGATFDIVNMTQFNGEITSLGKMASRLRLIDLWLTPTSSAGQGLAARSDCVTVQTCRIQRRIGNSGARPTLLVCGVDFATLTTLGSSSGGEFNFVYCGLRNVECYPHASGAFLFQDTHIQGGHVISTPSQTWLSLGGSVAGPSQPGTVGVKGTKGLGVFDAPTGKSGLSIKRGMRVVVTQGGLYGSGNAVYGVDVADGGDLEVQAAVTPYITGVSGDLIFDGAGTAIPELSAGAAVPAASALASWANWIAGPFTRNVVSYKNGSRIINVA